MYTGVIFCIWQYHNMIVFHIEAQFVPHEIWSISEDVQFGRTRLAEHGCFRTGIG